MNRKEKRKGKEKININQYSIMNCDKRTLEEVHSLKIIYLLEKNKLVQTIM